MTRVDFEKAVKKYRPIMERFAYTRLRSWPEAEDVVSRALTTLSTRYELLTTDHVSGASLQTLFIDYVNNEASNAASRTNMRARYKSEAIRDGRAAVQRDPYRLVDLRIDVQEAFRTLPRDVQYAAWRAYVEGYPWDHVAEEMGVGMEYIKKRAMRALRTLRPRLEAYRVPFKAGNTREGGNV